LEDPVVEEIVAYAARIAACVEVACVVDDAVSGYGQQAQWAAARGSLT
jgi:hypothetical protein